MSDIAQSRRQTSKKFKWDKGYLVKSELQKLAPQSDRVAVPRIPPESPGNSEPLGFAKEHALPPGKGAGAPAQPEAAGCPLRHATAVGDTCPAETEDSLALPAHTPLAGEEPHSSRSAQGGSTLHTEQAARPPLQTDDSVFLDEDSNQPMPVGRFFGNVELMQVRLVPPAPWPPPGSVSTGRHPPLTACWHCLGTDSSPQEEKQDRR